MNNEFRTHNCGELRGSNAGEKVKIAGWIHRKREFGNLLFVDLRDHYGITQAVVDSSNPNFKTLDGLRVESVVSIEGVVTKREGTQLNENMDTGEVEVAVEAVDVHSSADVLPMQVFGDENHPEDIRLKYRFLDLRREKLHKNMLLRSNVIASIRRRMIEQDFVEYQTPILTASSPEGARDFLVPSRVNPGMFYALPQAPQQFKQLLMVSGFDRYFQIAPCFRDEDPRADRSPGEFYQLDFEMSFATQDDVFNAIEPVMEGLFNEFSNGKKVSKAPFDRITYKDSMLKYGNDKPDLRNPLEIKDVTELFKGCEFGLFANKVEAGEVIRAIPAPKAGNKPRSFFDKFDKQAKEKDLGGVAYIAWAEENVKGIAKFLGEEKTEEVRKALGLEKGDAVLFVANQEKLAAPFAGLVRTAVGEELELIDENQFKFCWIVDFPMYEENEETGEPQFSHNPFSMPQGGMKALETMDPLDILAYQYDMVCNGVELTSGAIRNHRPEIMYKAFELAGYGPEVVDDKFGGMINAFKFGAPPHGGAAPGVDRIVMLLADEPNIREVILFPMNGKAQDLMMQAPNTVSDVQLKELNIMLNLDSIDI